MKRLGMLGLRLVPDGIGDAVFHLGDGAGIEASINPGLGSDCRKTILVEAAVGHNILRWPGGYYARFNIGKNNSGGINLGFKGLDVILTLELVAKFSKAVSLPSALTA